MFPIDSMILGAAALLIFAITSSKFSSRLGVPVLVLFIAVGMLAGSEGVGGFHFENYPLAHGIGTVALAVILFDGGLRTPLSSFRAALKPALALATLGVLLTALVTGLAAARLLGLSVLEGLLLGSIVGSTDAAAVFAVLRGQGMHLPDRVASTLEVESGSNDPMAVFLTVGLIEILLGRLEPGLAFAGLFLLQMGIGGVAGLIVGRLAAELNVRINLAAAGLYPVLMAAAGFFAYGLAATLGGSGFLSVYLAGIVLGNRRIVFHRGVYLFSDGLAWLGQIVMFIVLGLLSFPSRLLEVAPAGLAVAGVLVFVSRPLAVAALLFPFGFNVREVTFVSWAGLKGAVPIILAIFPLLLGVPNGPLLFNVVFFVVVVSALAQGWSLPLVARWLRLEVPGEPEAPVTLEITSLRDVNGDIVEYTVGPASRASGRLVRDLALPDGAVVAMIARGEEIIPPRGSTAILPDDHVFLVMRPGVRPLVDRVFSRIRYGHLEPLPFTEFPLAGSATVADLQEFYGVAIEAPPEKTLAALLRERLGRSAAVPGAAVVIGEVALSVREARGAEIELVGLSVRGEAGSDTGASPATGAP